MKAPLYNIIIPAKDGWEIWLQNLTLDGAGLIIKYNGGHAIECKIVLIYE